MPQQNRYPTLLFGLRRQRATLPFARRSHAHPRHGGRRLLCFSFHTFLPQKSLINPAPPCRTIYTIPTGKNSRRNREALLIVVYHRGLIGPSTTLTHYHLPYLEQLRTLRYSALEVDAAHLVAAKALTDDGRLDGEHSKNQTVIMPATPRPAISMVAPLFLLLVRQFRCSIALGIRDGNDWMSEKASPHQ